jgi:iron complex outermembrane receptor protein
MRWSAAVSVSNLFTRSALTVAVLAVLRVETAFADDAFDSMRKVQQVIVTGQREIEDTKTTGDAAALLEDKPGVSFYAAGGASKLPVLRGLNDDRIKLLIDGAQTTSACANHMNPSLSYVDASQVKAIDVIAGITPVSVGGDSIAGTIVIDSTAPLYAKAGESLHEAASLGAFYKSVSKGVGIAASAAIADEHFSLGYSGSVDRAESYKDGRGNTVLDTLYKSENHALTFGAKNDDQALTVKLGYQYIPYQGYLNQYMDMVGNRGDSVNVHYTHDFAWGKFDSRVYWQDAHHEMGFFTSEKTGSMPMNTHGKDIGYSLRGDIALGDNHTLRIGNDYHRFTLDDWWPALPGSMMMGPLDYININNGKRERFGVFAESEYRWDPQWTSLLGFRGDRVKTDTGDVQPYNTQNPIPMGMGGMGMGMPNPDASAAVAFNASNRSRSDTNIDVTALARYEPSTTSTYDFGYARKTRSPNLYERYSWGTGVMSSTMIGWFGDANGYVGNLDLKPEVANTISGTLDWHDVERKNWQFKAAPYFTYIENYIDVDQIGTFNPLMAMQVTLPQLQFANHDARLYGIDLSGQATLWNSDYFGRGVLKGALGYTHAERTDTGKSLYHIMPLNTRVSVEQAVGAWTNTVEAQLVDGKTRVEPLRKEQQTAGYALVNLRTSYRWQNLRVDLGVSNLFDRFYYLPLGGVNYAAWKAEGSVGQIGSVPGAGRSVDVGATLKF